ncbi:MAG: SEFIR domain-containing protein [Hyphomicrobiales bacterium]
MKNPKVFVSYSWTSDDHKKWVLNLSAELREAGIDVILDAWDLNEGDEANAFMEQMVSDPDVEKVIIVCDRVYAEKSDQRKGGAGTEAQIISSEIFKKQKQNKFVVVSTELDEQEEPVRPAYYTSRIFIPFINENYYSENFDQLLRWVYGQPQNKKPSIGKKPSYLETEEQKIILAIDSLHRRAIEAIRDGKQNAKGHLDDYFENFHSELEKFRWEEDVDYLGDEVMENLENFLPYRNQYLSIVSAIARYSNELEYVDCVHSFLEAITGYFYPKKDMGRFNSLQFDNFKFFGCEMFLLGIAAFLKANRFDLVIELLSRGYVNKDPYYSAHEPLKDYTLFNNPIQFFEHRNAQLKLRRISLEADLVKSRCSGSSITHNDIMQADFIIYLRSQTGKNNGYWWPLSLIYATDVSGTNKPFEVFARSESKKYFAKILPLLGLASKIEFDRLVDRFNNGELNAPKWNFNYVSVARLSNHKRLCTIP